MVRPTVLPVEEKVRVVPAAALAGELVSAGAARQANVSEQSDQRLEATVHRGRPR